MYISYQKIAYGVSKRIEGKSIFEPWKREKIDGAGYFLAYKMCNRL